MFTVRNEVGCLVEARVERLASIIDAEDYARALRTTVQTIPAARPPVLCADHRRVPIYSQPVASHLAQLFGDMNRRLGRIAVIVSRSNATLSLQLERIVREAANPSRRVMYTPMDAQTFLGEILDDAERERLARFLADER